MEEEVEAVLNKVYAHIRKSDRLKIWDAVEDYVRRAKQAEERRK